MKILKEPTKKWNYKFTCEACKAELEASESDILHQHYAGDQRESSYDKYYLQCPCCTEIATLKESSLPKLVVRDAKFRNTPHFTDR